MATPALPHVWTQDELEIQREKSVEQFIEWFKADENKTYLSHYQESLGVVLGFFRTTHDLIDLDPSALQGDVDVRREVARYIAGPPISDDDLRTVARLNASWERGRLQDVIDVILAVRDPVRFPWLEEPVRAPSEAEREMAVRWTAGLLAVQKAATDRRNRPSRRQESRVDAALGSATVTFTKVQPRPIASVRDLEPGEYCRQSAVAGTRADLTIALLDRSRVLALECKVSNSEVNSYKRLNHEVGNKRRAWQGAFGRSCVPGAVLAGAFSLKNLVSAQEAGIYLFWEHDLHSLVDFVERAI